MQNDRHPFAVNSLLRSLRRLENFFRIPVVIRPDTKDFVDSLLALCDTTDKPLFDFVLRLPSDALENELLKIAIPAERVQLLFTLSDEHERLAREKENAVADQNFKLGAECRDKQYEINDTIAELVPEPINISPEHLTAALRSLGFDGDLSA